MAANAQVRVEELRITSRTEGLDEARAKLGALAAAHAQAAGAAEGSAKATDSFGKSMRNPIAVLDGGAKAALGAARAFGEFERMTRAASQAAASGKADLDDVARRMDDAARAFGRAAGFKIKPETDLSGIHALVIGQKELSVETRRAVLGQFEQITAIDKAEERAARLRAGFDDLQAAQARLSAGIAEANQLRSTGSFSDEDVVRRTSQLNEAFKAQSKHLGVANDNLKLTSGQVQGLGYQINDVGTMLAMGASPFQVIASQAGQVVQVLQEGGGIKASLAAIGSSAIGFVRGLGPAGLALGALAAGAVAFGLATRKNVEPVEDVINRQSAAVRALRAEYGLAAKASEDYAGRSKGALAFESRDKYEADRKRLVGDAGDLVSNFFSGRANYARREGNDYAAIQKAVRDLQASAKDGVPDFVRFREELAKIAETDPSKGFLGGHYVRDFAKELLAASSDSAKLQMSLEGLGTALSEFARRSELGTDALKSAREEMAQFLPAAKTQAQQIEEIYQRQLAAINMAGGDDRDMQSRLRKAATDRDKAIGELGRPAKESLRAVQASLNNLDLSPVQRQIAETTQAYDERIAAYKASTDDAAGVAALQAEKEAALGIIRKTSARDEEARRAGYALDLKAVNDRTAAQKADTAAQRAYIDALGEGQTKAEASAAGDRARTIAMAQAKGQLAEATRGQELATSRQIEQAQLEFDLIGKSAGEAARLRAEFDMLAQAKDAARAAGFSDDTVTLTDRMREQAAEVGRLTEETQRLNFERDLLFERGQAFRSPQDQRIAEQLRSAGMEFDSVQGRAAAAQLRLNERLHETNDAFYEMRDAGKQALFDIVEAIGSGEDAFDGLMKAASGVFKQFASAGLDKLLGLSGLFGNGSSSTGSGGLGSLVSGAAGVLSTLTRSVGGGGAVPIPTARPTIAASDVAAVSGSMMSYAGRFNSSVDSRLLKILNTAASRFDMRVEAISGLRPGDPRFHGKGMATDVQIYAANGKALGNYQDPTTFRAYERLAQIAKTVQSELFPELEGMLRWGGYLSGGKGKYGALDTMHFDLGGKRVPMGGGSWENGLTDAQRKLWPAAQSVGMSKGEFQRTISQGTSQGVQDGIGTLAPPASPSASGGDTAPRQLTGGQQALMGLTGLIGAFSGGYESGSPLGGGLNGALGGFQVGSSLSFLGAAGGPVGAVVGAVAGIFGGILGKRKQKKQEEAENKRQWEAMQPQYEAYRRYLSGEESGNLRADFQNIQAQFNQFQAASVKAKNGDLADTAKTFYAYVERQLADFREASNGMAADLEAGLGPDGPFSKGKSAIRQLGKQLLGYLDDVEIANYKADNGLTSGAPLVAAEAAWKEERERALSAAKKAAQTQALSVLNPPKELSAVEQNFRSLEGAAQQLLQTLPKLGMSLEDTARRVAEEFAAGKATMRATFETDMADRLLDLQGKSYLTDAREMIAEFAQKRHEAGFLGADTTDYAETFRLQAQAIVDGSELTGEAFKELVARFPELAGVVTEFAETAAVTTAQIQESYRSFLDDRLTEATAKRAEAENDLISAYREQSGNLESFQKQVRDHLKNMDLGDTSSLDQRSRVDEAQRLMLDARARFDAGEEGAGDDLLNFASSYEELARAYWQSSPEFFKAQSEIKDVLKGADLKAESQIGLMRAQIGSLVDLNTKAKSIADLVSALKDAVERQASLQKEVDAGRSFGLNPERNRLIDGALKGVGLKYTGNYGLTNGQDQFLQWRTALPAEQLAVVNGIISQYIGINRQAGGLIPGFQKGGMIGNGTWNVDSVLARYAGGGSIALAGGEHITRATSVNRETYPLLAEMNRTGRVPDPYPLADRRRMPAANDAGAYATKSEIRELGQKLDRLAELLGSGFGGMIDATNGVSSATELAAAASRRAASKSTRAA